MFCRKCGKQILDDSRFCQYCGEAVQVASGLVIEKTITISPEIAKTGATISVDIEGITEPIEIMIPPKITNGQILRLNKAKMTEQESGKRVKKDVFLKISVSSKNEVSV